MAQDALSKLVSRHDRALTDAETLRRNARQQASTRRFCGQCWHVVDTLNALAAWQKERPGCDFGPDPEYVTACAGHWVRGTEWTIHKFEGVSVCPKCKGQLHEVTL